MSVHLNLQIDVYEGIDLNPIVPNTSFKRKITIPAGKFYVDTEIQIFYYNYVSTKYPVILQGYYQM